jgi:5'-3' exonuclease
VPEHAKPPVFLLDTMSFIFRAYHAMQRSRPMSTRGGLPTAAVYVFVNMIRKLRQDFQPRYFAAVFDMSGEVFRDERAQVERQDAELRRGRIRGLQGQSRRHARRVAPPDSLHPPRTCCPAYSHS